MANVRQTIVNWMYRLVGKTPQVPEPEIITTDINRIVITCMDRRLSSEAEKTYNDGRTLFARNAGGLPGGLKNTIKKALGENGNVKEIILMPHTDCGAMGAVFKCLMQGEKFDQDVLDGLVRYFENKPIQSREELENTLNGNECMREIVDIRKSVHGYEKKQIKITLEVVPLIASPPLPGEHNNVLVIMPASSVKYSETFGRFLDINRSYCIQGEIIDLIKDLKLATAHNGLNLQEIYIPRLKKEDDAKVNNIIKELENRLGPEIKGLVIHKLLENGELYRREKDGVMKKVEPMRAIKKLESTSVAKKKLMA